MNSISLRIKELIDYKKMNISSFEKKIGAGNNSIGTIINRNSNVSGLILSKILNSCEDVSADWLLLGKGEMFRNSESELKEKRKLSETDFREKLIEVLEIQNFDLKNDKIEILKDKSKIIEMLEEKLRNCEDEKKRNKIIS